MKTKKTKKAKKAKKEVNILEKYKKAAEMIMEDEPQIILPMETCEDCKKETIKADMEKCPDCGMKLCRICQSLHIAEHLEERYEEEIEEEERTNNPQWR